MRGFTFIAYAGFLVAGCGTTPPEPVTYAEPVSVHSILPVYVQLHEAYAPVASAPDAGFEFDSAYQRHFVESLKSELVNHGVFGSVSESGGDDIFEVDVNFARVSSFPDSDHYRITVALSTGYQGETGFSQYHVLFVDETGDEEGAPAVPDPRRRKVATELMSLIMGDIQQAVVDRKVRLKAHVKERSMDIPRVLVKW